MKRIVTKQTIYSSLVAVLGFCIFFLQNDILQGKNSTKSLVTITPFEGAKLLLTKVSGSGGQATLNATSGPDGSFTFPVVETNSKGSSMITYTLTVAPLLTYTVSDSKTTGPKATPVRTPVNVSIIFNQQKGLIVGGNTANNGPLPPIRFSTNDSVQIGVGFGGIISGTISKL